MHRPGLWIVLAAATWIALACDPKTPKPLKPNEPPKPIAAPLKAGHTVDDLMR